MQRIRSLLIFAICLAGVLAPSEPAHGNFIVPRFLFADCLSHEQLAIVNSIECYQDYDHPLSDEEKRKWLGILLDPTAAYAHSTVVNKLCLMKDNREYAPLVETYLSSTPDYAHYPPRERWMAVMDKVQALPFSGFIDDPQMHAFLDGLVDEENAAKFYAQWKAGESRALVGVRTDADIIAAIQARARQARVMYRLRAELWSLRQKMYETCEACPPGSYCAPCSEFRSAYAEAELFMDLGKEGYLNARCGPDFIDQLHPYFEQLEFEASLWSKLKAFF